MDIAEIRKKAKQRKEEKGGGDKSSELQSAPKSTPESTADSTLKSPLESKEAAEPAASNDVNAPKEDTSPEAKPEAKEAAQLNPEPEGEVTIEDNDNEDEDEALLLEIQRLEAAQLLEMQTEEPETASKDEAPLEAASVNTTTPEPPIEPPTEASTEAQINTDTQGELESKEEAETLQAIAFMLDNEEYAIEIGKLKEIITKRELTDVPRAPEGIMGVLSLRGVMVPVLNLRSRFGLPPTEDGERIIIVKDENDKDKDDELLGLLVDSVRHVVRIPLSTLEPPPTLNTIDEELIKGIGRYEGGSFILLDTDRMLEKI
jgi:purine-binding chemotaxis protein CheW